LIFCEFVNSHNKIDVIDDDEFCPYDQIARDELNISTKNLKNETGIDNYLNGKDVNEMIISSKIMK
jgi:hypothetical protein